MFCHLLLFERAREFSVEAICSDTLLSENATVFSGSAMVVGTR